jgi:6-phosphofructokinase 1
VHNTVNGSDYSLGFSTALARGVHFIHEVRAMAGSREEIAVIEILGRETGLTTMLISLLAGADRTLVPEVPFDPERLAALLVDDQRRNPSNYAILTMSEASNIRPDKVSKYGPELSRLANSRVLAQALATGGREAAERDLYQLAGDQVGLRASGSGPAVTEILENLTGQRLVFQPLSYLIRTGDPDGQDLLGAMNFATLAVNLLAAGKTGLLVAYRQRENYVEAPIDVVTGAVGNINVADYYDAGSYSPKPGILWAARV